jgi:hypothetical protein
MPIHDFYKTEQEIAFDHMKVIDIDKPLHSGKVTPDKTDKHKKCKVKPPKTKCSPNLLASSSAF